MSSIAIVHWPINDVGGIDSWCKNFCKGLSQLGVRHQVYYATPQTRYECSETEEIVKSRNVRLPSKHLSYQAEHLSNTVNELSRYDLICMLHPSPHPTRSFLRRNHHLNWMELYRQVNRPKLVVFHDRNWEKTNAWFADVAEFVDAAVAAQAMFIHPVKRYPADCPKIWEYFPLDLEKGKSVRMPLPDRRGVVVCTQWIKLKRHRLLLEILPEVKIPVDLYGNGQEYYELRKIGMFQQAVRKDHYVGEMLNLKVRHQFYGFVPYSSLLSSMGSAIASLDLSIKGHTNMTHWEPLTMGTVSMMDSRVSEHEDNQIPDDCCLVYEEPELKDVLNGLRSNSFRIRKIVCNADKFILRTDCKLVASRILDWLRKERVANIKVRR